LPSLLPKVNFLYIKWGNHSRRREDNIEVDLDKVGLGALTGFIFSGEGQEAGCCECGNERSDPIKSEDVTD
jgi:hypothetical protein